MDQVLSEITIKTQGEGFTDITSNINNWLKEKKVKQGIIVLSTNHTSCSFTINENADPNVLNDLSAYMKALVPENEFSPMNGSGEKKKYLHSQEGIDDMPAHIRTALTCSCLSLSVNEFNLVLGTWQAVYLWEHRYQNKARKLNLHAIGEINKLSEIKRNNEINSLLSKTNPGKINDVVNKTHAINQFSIEDEIETNIDLLIDRIHELSDQ